MVSAAATSLVRTASRSNAVRRQFSAQPKMHKAKDYWGDLKSKRPIDHDDLHVRTTLELPLRSENSKFRLTRLFFFPRSRKFSILPTTRSPLLEWWLLSSDLVLDLWLTDGLTSNTSKVIGINSRLRWWLRWFWLCSKLIHSTREPSNWSVSLSSFYTCSFVCLGIFFCVLSC